MGSIRNTFAGVGLILSLAFSVASSAGADETVKAGFQLGQSSGFQGLKTELGRGPVRAAFASIQGANSSVIVKVSELAGNGKTVRSVERQASATVDADAIHVELQMYHAASYMQLARADYRIDRKNRCVRVENFEPPWFVDELDIRGGLPRQTTDPRHFKLTRTAIPAGELPAQRQTFYFSESGIPTGVDIQYVSNNTVERIQGLCSPKVDPEHGDAGVQLVALLSDPSLAEDHLR